MNSILLQILPFGILFILMIWYFFRYSTGVSEDLLYIIENQEEKISNIERKLNYFEESYVKK